MEFDSLQSKTSTDLDQHVFTLSFILYPLPFTLYPSRQGLILFCGSDELADKINKLAIQKLSLRE